MSEITYKSAGVSSRETDLSSPSRALIVGVPAGVVGTAVSGPAFVPVTVSSFSEFTAIFGDLKPAHFGMLAAREWLRNATALTYTRVLGAGDGTKRVSSGVNAGRVNNAGFVAGARQVQDNGIVNANPYAYSGGPLGRTYFLGAFMSESAGSTFFSSAGAQTDGQASAIIRAVMMFPSGVVPALSSSYHGNSEPSTGPTNVTSNVRGLVTGSVGQGQSFVLLLNGHKSTPSNKAWITASFDEESQIHISRVFNMDPLRIEEKGHYLYAHFDVHSTIADITGSGVHTPGFYEALSAGDGFTGAAQRLDLAFILASSATHNSGTLLVPNYEGFEDRFQTAFSPFVVSQGIGGAARDLFRVHTRNDGLTPTTQIKITIENITKPISSTAFGTFDLVVRAFDPIIPPNGDPEIIDTEDNRAVLDAFRGLNLDPNSSNYIARRIGDKHFYFDFDRANRAQKIVEDGDYDNQSRLIRVEVSDALRNGEIPAYALPFGFRGPHHLVTSGSGIFSVGAGLGFTAAKPQQQILASPIVPPIPFRENLTTGESDRIVSPNLTWGVQFNRRTYLDRPNAESSLSETVRSHTRYFPSYHTNFQSPWVGNNAGEADANGTVFDADRFNNNFFSLERVRVVTGSDGKADPAETAWFSASYVRNGVIAPNDTNKTRALSVDDLQESGNRNYAKFSFFLQGGFDGVNIFDREKSRISNTAAKREMDDAVAQGGTAGPTVASFRRAVDTLTNKTDVDIQLLTTPGMRHTSITDYAITAVENRFDALYIMDVEEKSTLNTYVTSSDVVPKLSVTNTVSTFRSRALDSSFAAAYFPDVIVRVNDAGLTQRVPPSVAVLGAYSQNDKIGRSWFAPAGQTRGVLTSVTESTMPDLTQQNLDSLYDAKINPIIHTPSGVVVWGQKTLLATDSALDRVNVRRLLIEIRRQVRAVANTLLFEPNRESTLAAFRAKVNPILQRVQEGAGVVRYRVQIDTTTTTQADVENNTIRGKIYIQPTRTAEFVALDFVVSNTGAEL